MPLEAASAPVADAVAAPSARLQALDALRGFTIALMILVNTSGDSDHTFATLRHSRWNGCTLADVVFPCFLWIVGISIVLSVRARLRRGVAPGLVVRQALVRSLVLFALGLAVNSFPRFDLHTLRVFGVLQRIALCSFAATVLYLFVRVRTVAWIAVAILLGYAALLRFVPVPGYGVPTIAVPLLDPHGNLPAWLDRTLVPANHLYHQGFYDPEGLLGSVSSMASTLLGVLTGVLLLRKTTAARKAVGLALAGAVCVLAGLLWSHWLPLNKRLWTSSFVVFNAGVSLLALACFFGWLDLWRRGTRLAAPLLIFGTNALAAYALSEFLASLLGEVRGPGGLHSLQQWLYRPFAAAISDPYLAALAYAVVYVALCFVPILWLYRRRIFLKV